MKSGIKSAIRIASFLLILVVVLMFVNSIFKFKYGDGIYSIKSFYAQEENSVDVLVLGSSHAFEEVNTGYLWDNYGIASYVLAGSVQPVWNSYYYLKEALKTQKPKLVIFEGFMLTYPENEYMTDENVIKNTFGMRSSLDKYYAKRASIGERSLKGLVLEYPYYHSRYKDIYSADFKEYYGNALYKYWKGYDCNYAWEENAVEDVSQVSSRVELPSKVEHYYRMLIELAQKNGIPILIAVAPYGSINEEEQGKLNKASDIASEYGVEFINYNTHPEEIGIDEKLDYADRYHLNYRGNEKLTKALGEYVKSEYDIPDRRGDEYYSSWEDSSTYQKADLFDFELPKINNPNEYICKLENNGKLNVIVLVNGKPVLNESSINSLNLMGINDLGVYVKNDETVAVRVEDDDFLWEKDGESFRALAVYSDSDSKPVSYEIYINGKRKYYPENSINIFVYDTVTEKAIDFVTFTDDDNNLLVR